MNYIKNIKTYFVLFLTLFLGSEVNAQIIAGNAYMIGDRVNIAIDGAKGKEGTATAGGFHYRGGSSSVPSGFVSDPGDTGWDATLFDGDFFTP